MAGRADYDPEHSSVSEHELESDCAAFSYPSPKRSAAVRLGERGAWGIAAGKIFICKASSYHTADRFVIDGGNTAF